MGTAILRPHDCLQERLRNDSFTRPTSHATSRRNHPNRNRRRKRNPVAAAHANKQRHSSAEKSLPSTAAANLVMGQVMILKRGEKLSPVNRHREARVHDEKLSPVNRHRDARVHDLDLFLGSTSRLCRDPVIVPKKVRVLDRKDGIYAGSAFVSSPAPSSVPVPDFLRKNGAATSNLRRLLRIDLE